MCHPRQACDHQYVPWDGKWGVSRIASCQRIWGELVSIAGGLCEHRNSNHTPHVHSSRLHCPHRSAKGHAIGATDPRPRPGRGILIDRSFTCLNWPHPTDTRHHRPLTLWTSCINRDRARERCVLLQPCFPLYLALLLVPDGDAEKRGHVNQL